MAAIQGRVTIMTREKELLAKSEDLRKAHDVLTDITDRETVIALTVEEASKLMRALDTVENVRHWVLTLPSDEIPNGR
jgi:nitrogen regulatory protein PII-like uncharacterized protein